MPPSYQSSPLDLERMQNLNRVRDQEAMQNQDRTDEQARTNGEEEEMREDEEEQELNEGEENSPSRDNAEYKKTLTIELIKRAGKNGLRATRNQSMLNLSDTLIGYGQGCNVIPVVGSIIGMFPLATGYILKTFGKMTEHSIDKEFNAIKKEAIKAKIDPNSFSKWEKAKLLTTLLKQVVLSAMASCFGVLSIIIIIGSLLVAAVCALPGMC